MFWPSITGAGQTPAGAVLPGATQLAWLARDMDVFAEHIKLLEKQYEDKVLVILP